MLVCKPNMSTNVADIASAATCRRLRATLPTPSSGRTELVGFQGSIRSKAPGCARRAYPARTHGLSSLFQQLIDTQIALPISSDECPAQRAASPASLSREGRLIRKSDRYRLESFYVLIFCFERCTLGIISSALFFRTRRSK